MSAVVRRARPALGTLIEFRVAGLAAAAAQAAIDAAHAEVLAVHRAMSFHAPDSDLSRLHRAAPGTPVAVDPRTHEVLTAARRLAAASDGCFDPTVATRLVARGFLPAPRSSRPPDPEADWRDLELLDDGCVRLRRPLWLDLGGIAKGYAVDRAVALLRAHGAQQGSVNAGGDLRVFGPRAELVHLRLDGPAPGFVPVLELGDGAVAGSAGLASRRRRRGRWCGPHLDGRRRRGVRTDVSVSVVAASCLLADALTKIVLAADRRTARRLLAEHGAQAIWHDPHRGWRRFEA